MHRQSASHMGTNWHIALYSRDTKSANAAFSAAWKVIGEIDGDLTNYSSDSELNRLCATAPHEKPVAAGKHLWTVMLAARDLSRQTDGAFDVTIGPVSKLWRRAHKKKQMPDAEKLAEAKQAVGYQLIKLHDDDRSIQLTHADMQLDLGGIAKGYAVDQALETLKQNGITRALVNGGGDLAVLSTPPGESAWQVEASSLDPRKEFRSVLLADAAIATSGDAWQYLIVDGKRYSHIIDPRTGLGTTHRITASVTAPTCMQADSLASAACVLPPAEAMKLLQAHKDVQATIIMIDDAGNQRRFETRDQARSH